MSLASVVTNGFLLPGSPIALCLGRVVVHGPARGVTKDRHTYITNWPVCSGGAIEGVDPQRIDQA